MHISKMVLSTVKLGPLAGDRTTPHPLNYHPSSTDHKYLSFPLLLCPSYEGHEDDIRLTNLDASPRMDFPNKPSQPSLKLTTSAWTGSSTAVNATAASEGRYSLVVIAGGEDEMAARLDRRLCNHNPVPTRHAGPFDDG